MTLRVRAMSPAGDMLFGQGKANFFADVPDAVAQILGTRLKLWQGEWFLNLRAGTPWLQSVLGRGTLPLATTILRAAMTAAPGVSSVGGFSAVLDPASRIFTVSATSIDTIFGAAGAVSFGIAPSGGFVLGVTPLG